MYMHAAAAYPKMKHGSSFEAHLMVHHIHLPDPRAGVEQEGDHRQVPRSRAGSNLLAMLEITHGNWHTYLHAYVLRTRLCTGVEGETEEAEREREGASRRRKKKGREGTRAVRTSLYRKKRRRMETIG